MFSCGTTGELRVCVRCAGIIQPCGSCRQYHLVVQGRGGPGAMPAIASEAWLTARRCPNEDFGEVPVSSVRTPPHFEPFFEEFATYGEISNRSGFYELESFSS